MSEKCRMLVRTQIGGTVDTRKRFAFDPVALNMILVPEPVRRNRSYTALARSEVGISGLPDSHAKKVAHASMDHACIPKAAAACNVGI